MDFLRCFPVIALLLVQTPSRDASLSSALAKLNQGRVLDSIAEFKEVLRSDPVNGPAYYYLSTLYTEMGEFETAERYLHRAMELNPKQGAHYHQLGLIRYRQKQWRPALEFFRQALELGAGANEAAVWRSIGDVQLELFDRDAALDAYKTALRLQPDNARTRLALGRFYLERSEPDAAIAQLREALEIDPSLRAAYPLLGRAYRQNGELTNAIAILKKALETDSADQESRYALGQILLADGRAEEGRKELDQYEDIERQVVTANANYSAAQSLLEAGKRAEAEQLLRETLRLAPKYGAALSSLGALLLDGGSAGKAVELLNRAVDANPLNAASWFNLSRAYLKDGKAPEALEAIKQALVLNDGNPDYQRLLAEIQARVRR